MLIVSARRLFPNATPEIVLFANMALLTVPLSAVPTNVPLVGKVTDVAAVTVIVVANAPLVVKLPPNVIVLVPLSIPVPPYAPAIILPFQVPLVIVPTAAALNTFQDAVPSAAICKTDTSVGLDKTDNVFAALA